MFFSIWVNPDGSATPMSRMTDQVLLETYQALERGELLPPHEEAFNPVELQRVEERAYEREDWLTVFRATMLQRGLDPRFPATRRLHLFDWFLERLKPQQLTWAECLFGQARELMNEKGFPPLFLEVNYLSGQPETLSWRDGPHTLTSPA